MAIPRLTFFEADKIHHVFQVGVVSVPMNEVDELLPARSNVAEGGHTGHPAGLLQGGGDSAGTWTVVDNRPAVPGYKPAKAAEQELAAVEDVRARVSAAQSGVRNAQAELVAAEASAPRVHFVTHSMSGIVLRCYLRGLYKRL